MQPHRTSNSPFRFSCILEARRQTKITARCSKTAPHHWLEACTFVSQPTHFTAWGLCYWTIHSTVAYPTIGQTAAPKLLSKAQNTKIQAHVRQLMSDPQMKLLHLLPKTQPWKYNSTTNTRGISFRILQTWVPDFVWPSKSSWQTCRSWGSSVLPDDADAHHSLKPLDNLQTFINHPLFPNLFIYLSIYLSKYIYIYLNIHNIYIYNVSIVVSQVPQPSEMSVQFLRCSPATAVVPVSSAVHSKALKQDSQWPVRWTTRKLFKTAFNNQVSVI